MTQGLEGVAVSCWPWSLHVLLLIALVALAHLAAAAWIGRWLSKAQF